MGTPMADLLGGINQFQLPNSSITVELGFERLYHVNGTYREDFVPEAVSFEGHTASDPELDAALRLLKAI
jgi:carboxyl-terminal processing protease